MDYLERQRRLQVAAYDRDPVLLTGEDGVEFVRWNILAAIRELTEMLNEVDGWKPWQTMRDNAGEFKHGRAKYIDEGVDVLHFMWNLFLYAAVDDKELSQAFDDKQAINLRRQETGYAGDGAAWAEENR